MKKLCVISTVLSLLFFAHGCILMHSVSYEINANGKGGGTAVVTVDNIKSDALNSGELNDDKKALFEFMYKSDEFISQMKDEGKEITSRKLYVEDDKLYGEVHFKFESLNNVEGIVYEEPFYYLTLATGDSVISTNGEVIKTDDYKRILWDNSIKVLKFRMFSDSVDSGNLTGMAQYFKQE
jgi:hypothetical protein